MIDPAPYDLVASRLDRVVGPRESSRAACPLQCSRSRNLSIREQPDGGVLLHCFALHCEVRAIVSALGLELRDLIAPSKRRRSAQTKHERVEAAIERSWEATIAGTAPSHVIESALAAATKAELQRERERFGYEPPLSSRLINRARRSVGIRFARTLAPLPPFAWERCFPHSLDPLWPVLLERGWFESWIVALDAVPPAPFDRYMDFGKTGIELAIAAEDRAAEELHRIAPA